MGFRPNIADNPIRLGLIRLLYIFSLFLTVLLAVAPASAYPRLELTTSGSRALPLDLRGAKNEYLLVVMEVEGAKAENLKIELQGSVPSGGLEMQVYQLRPVPASQPQNFLADGLAPLEKGLVINQSPLLVALILKISSSLAAGNQHYDLYLRSGAWHGYQPLNLEVWNFSLPKDLPITIMAHFRPNTDWFQRYHVSSQEAFDDVLEAYFRSMRDYKINSIAGFYPLPYKRVARGEPLTSFPQFDRMLTLIMNQLGYRYFRVPSPSGGKKQGPDMAEVKEMCDTYFPRFYRYSQGKGWTGKALVKVWDEPQPGTWPRVAQAYGYVKAAVPQLRTECTGKMPPLELAKVVDIWSISYLWYDPVRVNAARQKGQEFWLYANKLHGVDRTPAHQRLIGWHLYSHRFSGYYLWGVNAWHEDPWSTTSGRSDHFRRGEFYYPNPKNGRPLPTLRLEALRTGLQDYQYLTLLDVAVRQGKVSAATASRIKQEAIALTRDLNNPNPKVTWEDMERLRLQMGELLDQAQVIQ